MPLSALQETTPSEKISARHSAYCCRSRTDQPAFRHSEIQAFHPLRGGGHDIFGLEVAIDDATGMGCHQGICALHGDIEKLLNSVRIPPAQRAG
jgi:hypothetical protein